MSAGSIAILVGIMMMFGVFMVTLVFVDTEGRRARRKKESKAAIEAQDKESNLTAENEPLSRAA